jgi:hypothetical protein
MAVRQLLREAQFRYPIHSTMAGNIQRQFESAPDSQLVEGAQIVLHYLFTCRNYFGDIAVRQTFPNQRGYLDFLFALTDRGAAWFHLLLCKHGGCQFDSLAALSNSGSQEQRPQMLFDGSWADVLNRS